MTPQEQKILGFNFFRLRTQSGLTQDDVIDTAEVERRHYQPIESGQGNPTLKVLKKIRQTFLNAQWNDLLHGIGEPPGENEHDCEMSFRNVR